MLNFKKLSFKENMLDFNSENTQSSIIKFESMLKTNHVYFFDAQEFEDIIVHYLGFAENNLAKKH